ncbi:hypothetical protein C8F01DRAFT_1224517 [Mycena amicta]|nr:hypothetical protein C8F01DRAFT_1224517 [Mycena amicta]
MSRSVPTRRSTFRDVSDTPLGEMGVEEAYSATIGAQAAQTRNVPDGRMSVEVGDAVDVTSSGDSGVPNNETMNTSATRFRVMITLWRLLNLTAILILGIIKIVSTYDGQTATATINDWILGLVVAAISYVGGCVHEDNPGFSPWLFTDDFSWVPRWALHKLWGGITGAVGRTLDLILSAFHWIAGVKLPERLIRQLRKGLIICSIGCGVALVATGSVVIVEAVSTKLNSTGVLGFILVTSALVMALALCAVLIALDLLSKMWMHVGFVRPEDWDVSGTRIFLTLLLITTGLLKIESLFDLRSEFEFRIPDQVIMLGIAILPYPVAGFILVPCRWLWKKFSSRR